MLKAKLFKFNFVAGGPLRLTVKRAFSRCIELIAIILTLIEENNDIYIAGNLIATLLL